MTNHVVVPSTPDTLSYGWFDPGAAPVARVPSGAEVEIQCLPAGGFDNLPDDPARVLPEHSAALEALSAGRGPAGHMITGPVYVEDAMPGDMLQVDILDITLRQDWGFTLIAPLVGALPQDFDTFEQMIIDIDAVAGTCTLPWGLTLPLDPFFGILATAPPTAWGRIGTAEPRAMGGNMDNKELRVGSTVYLPVFQPGALFMAGDGHGRQGDGEVCITALETALTGRFRLTVRKDLAQTTPFAETETHLISMGFHESLDEAMRCALRQMIDMVCDRTGLSRNKAYMLLSLAGDLRITQVVDGEKGVHMMMRKDWLQTA